MAVEMIDTVQHFNDLAMQFVNDSILYAKNGVFDEQTDANIRQLRVVTSVLISALLQAQLPPQQPAPPAPFGPPPQQATQTPPAPPPPRPRR